MEKVEVRPATILAQPGLVFSLEAVAKGPGGKALDLGTDPNLAIEWSARPGVIADPADNPAIITVPDWPSEPLTIQAKVRELDSGRTLTSNPVVLRVSPLRGSSEAAALGASDWALVEHMDKSPAAALLVQGTDGVTGLEDWAVGVVGSVRLEVNLSGAVVSGAGATNAAVGPTKSEAVVFSHDRYPDAWRADPLQGFWTPATDEVPSDPMRSFGDFGADYYPRSLYVLGLVHDRSAPKGGATMEDWAYDQIQRAFWMLNRNRAGIELDMDDPGGVLEHELKDPLTGAPIPVTSPGGTCTDVNRYLPQDVDVNGNRTYLVDGVPETLFVFFVPDILFTDPDGGQTQTRSGWACTPEVGWRGRVVFVSEAETSATTLAHELGHVLGLTLGQVEGVSGHVNSMEGFDGSNLMWSFSSGAGRGRRHLTLGQMYRMNMDPESWLNLLLPVGDRVLRNCQFSAGRGVCPALAADLGG